MYVPTIIAMLKHALTLPSLAALSCRVWLCMLRLANDDVISAHLSSMVVSLLSLFPVPPAKDGSVPHVGGAVDVAPYEARVLEDGQAGALAVLHFLLIEKRDEFGGRLHEIPCVPDIPVLREISEVSVCVSYCHGDCSLSLSAGPVIFWSVRFA